MLLSMLTLKFPLFNSTDDLEALMEIAAIFGRASMEKCAMLHSEPLSPFSSLTQGRGYATNTPDRTIITNCPTVDQAPKDLGEMILTLNPHIYTPPLPNPTREEAIEHIRSIDDAIDLCTNLLKLDATRRYTAKKALGHKFFSKAEGYEPEVDHPILSGVDGKCGHLHSVEDGKRESSYLRATWGVGLTSFRPSLVL